jgi:hypothetical protein
MGGISTPWFLAQKPNPTPHALTAKNRGPQLKAAIFFHIPHHTNKNPTLTVPKKVISR